MKKLLLTACAITFAVSVFAQGTVIFNNRVGGTVITHVYGPQAGNPNQSITGNGATDLPVGTTSYTGALLLGANYLSQLLAANGANAAADTLQAASTAPVSFRTAATGAGWVNATTATLSGVPADAAVATIRMVAWDNTSGNYTTWATAQTAWQAGTIAAGMSPLFNLNAIGGQSNPAQNLTGLQSFNIYFVPEPSTMALAGLGAAALLIFRRRK